MRRRVLMGTLASMIALAVLPLASAPAGAGVTVGDEAALQAAWTDGGVTDITLTADITLTCGGGGAGTRATSEPVALHGGGHTLTQTCADAEVLSQTGTGAVVVDDVTLSGGAVGIHAEGPVSVSRAVIAHLAGSSAAIGILADPGALTVTDTVITDVVGQAVAAGVIGWGAVDVTRTRIASVASPGGQAFGLLENSAAPVSVVDSTIADVTSGNGAVGIQATGAALTLRGTSLTGLHGVVGAVGMLVGSADVVDVTVRDVVGTIAVGIEVFTDLVVGRSTVADVAGDGPLVAGIFAYGVGTVEDTTVTRVTGPGIVSTDDLTVVFSTITATGRAVGAGSVEAPDVVDLGGVRILDGAFDPTSQVLADSARVRLFGTVVADPNAGVVNCRGVDTGVVESLGHDRADDTTCGLTAVGDLQQVGFDPQLGALADNGGPTPTLLPSPTSPLVDAIPFAACVSGPAAGITTDQRGLPRAAFAGCDVGAVELQPDPPAPEPTFTG